MKSKIYLEDVRENVCGISTVINLIACIFFGFAISDDMRDPEGFPSAMGLVGLLPLIIIAIIARYLHKKLADYPQPTKVSFWIVYTIYVALAITSIALFIYWIFSNK